MSFFRKKTPEAPRPVPQKIAESTPRPVINTAAAEQDKLARRSSTKLTGPRGIEEDAKTKKKSLLGA